ncbi:GreA/GreB family elongation factor [Fulvivirga ulvae]|uniref:GreA/GreB family elongation factor n=1 Tax=Fulvivirga ulvae TaxID=2904245 RepID=UPI001F202D39|nr:GreA/GreB family elongation factor [Fulvivirga ulvae]UII35018.1 GreA/GreB family elongation factor [Fulvivirga ulvae]
MKYENIILEENEYILITGLLNRYLTSEACLNEDWCLNLNQELSEAVVKSNSEMPGDVVRMNSVIDVETDFGVKNDIILVKPAERDINDNKVSVLSPMGSALIGYAQGDQVVWNLPKGKSIIKILRVTNK